MKKEKHFGIFVAILFIVSMITGFIYGINNYYDLTDYIKGLTTNNNYFFMHLSIFFIFLFSTISLLGIIVQSVYIGFEGVSVGYLLAIFYTNFKIKGLFYGLITILTNKLIFLIIIMYLFYISYKYIKKSIKNIVGLNKDYFSVIIKPLLLKYAIIFVVILINDTLIYLFGNKLLNYLTNML